MSDPQQIKVGQRGTVLQLRTGENSANILAQATSLVVRIRGEDGVRREYNAVVSPTDPTAIELTIAAGMFDTVGTVTLDAIAKLPGGKEHPSNISLTIDVVDL